MIKISRMISSGVKLNRKSIKSFKQVQVQLEGIKMLTREGSFSSLNLTISPIGLSAERDEGRGGLG